ncbi:hypothetical protein J7643_17840 [bacterium]|nr:hypothetical protein [bacterium]
METPLAIASGQILVYHLFTVADTVDLDRLGRALGADAVIARFTPRRPTPEYLQYRNPPLTFSLGTHTLHPRPEEALPARVSAKIFDFGVLALRWEVPCPATWDGLVQVAGRYIDNPAIEVLSRQILHDLQPRLAPFLKNPPREALFEDYTIFYVQGFAETLDAEHLLTTRGPSLAQLMRGEAKALSAAEQAEVLGKRISYFADDLAVIDWNTAFIYDPEGATEHMDALEFANAELLELRFYDRLLDEQLDAIYHEIERGQALPRWKSWLRNDYQRTQQRLMAVTVDVIELTEQIENALKFIGDLYSARIYRAIAERLRLSEWEASIDGKIRTAQEVYQMLTDQVNTRRSVALELIIILLIAFEVVMALTTRH